MSNDTKTIFDISNPPSPEELDAEIHASPWILRARLTLKAFQARCCAKGKETTMGMWLDHIKLDDEELQLLKDLIESQRDAFCLDELGPAFIIRDYGNKARVGSFDVRGELTTKSYSEFKNAHIEKNIEIFNPITKKLITKELALYWLKHPLTRRYDHVEFKPGIDKDNMPEGVLNLWRGWPIGLIAGWDDYKQSTKGPIINNNTIFDKDKMPERYCDTFINHMLNNMCGGDAEVYHYLLCWIADALWNPGPCDTAIVLQGPQGSGKTFWAEKIMELFAPHAITLDDENQLIGNFNKHLMNKSIVFADEAFFAGNRKHAAKLKTLITRPDMFIEPKGVDGFIVQKKFRLIMASNDEHIIRAERDDRRNLVLSVEAGQHNQDHHYFAKMHKEWNEGGRRAFYRWLTGAYWGSVVGDSKFKMIDRPITVALQEQKDRSLPEAQMVIHNILREGELPCDFKSDSNGNVFVATQMLIAANKLREAETRALSDALKIIAIKNSKSVRETVGEGYNARRRRGYWLPPLDQCRKAWEVSLIVM